MLTVANVEQSEILFKRRKRQGMASRDAKQAKQYDNKGIETVTA